MAGGLAGLPAGLPGAHWLALRRARLCRVIGTIIGAILGGLLGGAFQQTPPRGFTEHEVGVGTLRQAGKKGFDPNSFDPLTRGIDDAIVSLGKLLEINTEAARYWIGFKEGEGFRTTIRGQGDVNFQKEEQLQRAIILQELADRAETPFQKAALSRASENKRLKSVVESIGSDVSFKEKYEEFVESGGKPRDVGKEMAKELRAMDREFKKMREHAEDLGLSLKGFSEATKRVKDEFKSGFTDQLAAFVNFGKPRELAAEMEQLEVGFAEMRRTAESLDVSLKGFDEAAERARQALKDEFLAEFESLVPTAAAARFGSRHQGMGKGGRGDAAQRVVGRHEHGRIRRGRAGGARGFNQRI